MAKSYYTTEGIIGKPRQAEVLLGKGKSTDQAVREIGVTKNTYYRWRQEYGAMKLDQAKRLKEMEVRTIACKRAVAELILREVSKGKF